MQFDSTSGAVTAPDRWRIDHFVLRRLDSRRAELRVSAIRPDAFDGRVHSESAEPSHSLRLELDETAASRAVALIIEPTDFPNPPCEPQTWTAVVPLDALPEQTRDVLEMAADLYDTPELDLSPCDELEQLLLTLRATTWTPEPRTRSLH